MSSTLGIDRRRWLSGVDGRAQGSRHGSSALGMNPCRRLSGSYGSGWAGSTLSIARSRWLSGIRESDVMIWIIVLYRLQYWRRSEATLPDMFSNQSRISSTEVTHSGCQELCDR